MVACKQESWRSKGMHENRSESGRMMRLNLLPEHEAHSSRGCGPHMYTSSRAGSHSPPRTRTSPSWLGELVLPLGLNTAGRGLEGRSTAQGME